MNRSHLFLPGFLIPAGLLLLLFLLALPLAVLRIPAGTALLEDRRGDYLSEDLRGSSPIGFWPVSVDENPLLVTALLSVEDRRFYRHPGVDLEALVRSALSTVKGRRQGGSTIAMQLVRLCHPEPRTVFNKAREILGATLATACYGKRAILEGYLCMAPQGNRISGFSYASRRYFHKPVADLSLAECCLLSALPQSPGRMNPYDAASFERARARAFLVLQLVESSRKVDGELCGLAREELASMRHPRRERRSGESLHFIERVLELQRAGNLYAPIVTSLDPEIQWTASSILSRAVEENSRFSSGNAAMVVADAKTGEILAWAGSMDYFDVERSGAIDYCVTPRSSGSSLKPFLYAEGLDSGLFTPASILADLPFSVLSPSGEYRVDNFDRDYLGPMLYGRALANSRNIPAIRVLESLGADRFLERCRSLGLARSGRNALWYGYGLAIGGLEVTLRDLVAAWATLENDGRRRELSFLRLGEKETPSGEALFSPSSSRLVLRWLSDPEARAPSFPRLGGLEYNWPVAVKTGTSQGFRDAWAVAASRSYIVGMWMGRPDNLGMNRIAGSLASAYVHQMMDALHPLQKEGIDEELFPAPEGAVPVELCPLSGELATGECPVRVREWFQPDAVPRSDCSVHRRLVVDRLTGILADERTPASRLQVQSFTVLPPEYAWWGSLRGYSAPATSEVALASVHVVSPKSGARYLLDADIPARFQTIELRALASPQRDVLSWYVDGALFSRSSWPHTLRWPLREGAHRIEAVLSDGKTRSEVVEIEVE